MNRIFGSGDEFPDHGRSVSPAPFPDDLERAASSVADRFGAEVDAARAAVARAVSSPGREVRLAMAGERRGRSCISLRLERTADGREGLLVCCFKTGEGGFIPLRAPMDVRGGLGVLRNGEGGDSFALRSARWSGKEGGASMADGEAEARRERERLAAAIQEESLPVDAALDGWNLAFGADYARRKGLAGFDLPAGGGSVAPCPAVRRTSRSYAVQGRCSLREGTPFWALRDSGSGQVRGIQFKFWSRGEGGWLTRTIGACKGCWVLLAPEGEGGDGKVGETALVEGVATAWALHRMLSGRVRVIATLGTSGLADAALCARRRWPAGRLAVVADLDRGRQGEVAAYRAAEKTRAQVFLPVVAADASRGASVPSLRQRGFDAWDLWAFRRGRMLPKGLDDLCAA